jgi:dolichol-phosphate mannosyltransferase
MRDEAVNGGPRSIAFLVPVYNEAENIPSLIEAFRSLAREFSGRLAPRFVVVDDGSRDQTAASLGRLKGDLDLSVLVHPENRGPGRAFATGFEFLAPGLGPDDWIVTMEGDNTSRHELVAQMLKRTEEGYDIVLASPYLYGGGIVNTSFLRTFLSYGANIVMKEILEIRGIMTMSSFFRLYRGSAIKRLQACYGPGIIDRDGFDCMVELLMKTSYLKLSLSEVAMVLDTSRRKGRSKMKLLRAMWDLATLAGCKRRWKLAAGIRE